MKDKKAFEMSFAWIFAIIVGAAILFIAIYATSKFVSVKRYEIDTATAAKLSILLDPLETGLESAKSSSITFNQETRIFNKCFTSGNFGKHSISLTSKSGIGGDWKEPGGDTQIYNKYIFSEGVEQGKEFSVFTKPLDMPFKISDLIFLTSKKYCFVSLPEELEELESLNLKNIAVTETKENCPEDSEIVCFGVSSGCDITVYKGLNYNSGSVIKNKKTMYYSGPLVYGAIFSSPDIYECNVKRLMLRLINLGLVYKDKVSIIERRGCGNSMNSQLSSLIDLARNLDSSEQLLLVHSKAEELDNMNEISRCRLF